MTIVILTVLVTAVVALCTSMTHAICSQCKEVVPETKGFTVSYYQGNKQNSFKCCSVACVDKLVKKKRNNQS